MRMNKSGTGELVLAGIAVLAVTALLWIKINSGWLDSDQLYMEGISKDLLLLGGHWSDWKFSPAPDYFPDMLLYLLCAKFIASTVCRIFIVSALQVVFLSAAVVWLARTLHPAVSARALAILLLLIGFFTLVCAKSAIWIYFYSTNSHFASLLLTVFNLAVAIRFFRRPSAGKAVLFIATGILAALSTRIYFLSFLFPAILFALFLLTRKGRALFPDIGAGTKIGFALANPLTFVVENVLSPLISKNDVLGQRVPFTLKAARNSLKLCFETLVNSFSLESGYRLVFSVAALACVLFLISKARTGTLFRNPADSRAPVGRESAEQAATQVDGFAFVALFVCFVAPINFLGAVLSGGYVDLEGFRYFAGLIAVVMVLAVTVADRDGFLLRRHVGWSCRAVAIFLTLASAGFFLAGRSHDAGVPPIVSCLDKIEKDGFHLEAGTADYWYARGVSHYLPNKNWIVTTDHDMSPLFWMSSLGPIAKRQHYGYHYNFVIIRDPGTPIYFDYTAQTIGKLLPEPSRKLYCPASHATVWIYANDDLDVALKNAFDQFLFNKGLAGTFAQAGQSLPGTTGAMSGTTRRAAAGTDAAGFLTYGPYANLRKGRYRVTISYVTRGGDGGNYLDMIGTVKAKTGVQLFRQELQRDGEHEIGTVIDTEQNAIGNFEVRTWFSGHGELVFKNLTISRMP
ncbi:hypothetical protein [Robbsia betulipollinis]|nr:hypothetical protein [Robbsia betulipollinis]